MLSLLQISSCHKQIKNSVVSTDSDLSSTIENVKAELPSIHDVKSWEQALQLAVAKSAIELGEALLKQTAVLLPNMYDSFVKCLNATAKTCGIPMNLVILGLGVNFLLCWITI